MIYEEIIKAVENGAKFTVNFQKRTCRVNGKVIVNDMQYDGFLGTYPSFFAFVIALDTVARETFNIFAISCCDMPCL